MVWFMVFNTTFNNISAISWRSVLLVEETGVPGENHWPVASHWQTLSCNTSSWTGFELITLVVIGTLNPTTIRSWTWQPLNINLLVDRNTDGAEEQPLSNIMHVHSDEKHNNKHQQHPPEFPAPPLRQSKLCQELTTHIL